MNTLLHFYHWFSAQADAFFVSEAIYLDKTPWYLMLRDMAIALLPIVLPMYIFFGMGQKKTAE